MVFRWDPTIEFARLFDQMERLVSEMTSGLTVANGHRQAAVIQPAVDLYDTGDHLVLKALLPGVKPEDLEVSVEQSTLTIAGRFGIPYPESEAKQATWYRHEIGQGRFVRSIALPAPIESDKVEATFENGVLTLSMPKVEQARVKRIPVHAPKALAESHS